MTGMKRGFERDSLALDTHSFRTLGPWVIMMGLINTEHSMYRGTYSYLSSCMHLSSITNHNGRQDEINRNQFDHLSLHP